MTSKTFWNSLTAVGTIAMAVASFFAIRKDSLRERNTHIPFVTFDFFDCGENENLGPPGFRHLTHHPEHSAIRLSGYLRNLSATPAVDLKLDIYFRDDSSHVHEIQDIFIHDGLSASDRAKIERDITLDDVTPNQDGTFSIGIAGLFDRPSKTGVDYPFAVVLSYKNILGDSFFSVYTMKVFMRKNANQLVSLMFFKGSERGLFTWKWMDRINQDIGSHNTD